MYVYEIPSFTTPLITDAYNTAASDNQVDSVNSSFGGCEEDIGAKTFKYLYEFGDGWERSRSSASPMRFPASHTSA